MTTYDRATRAGRSASSFVNQTPRKLQAAAAPRRAVYGFPVKNVVALVDAFVREAGCWDRERSAASDRVGAYAQVRLP